MTSLANLNLPEKPLDWHTSDALIRPEIALAATNSLYACYTEAKIANQQISELFYWYSNIGEKGWNSISLVSFSFPMGTVNEVSVFPTWTSILR